MIRHLLGVPSGADSEHEAPGRNHIERRHLLRQHDRIAFDDKTHTRPELDFLRYARRRRQRHKWIVRMAVLRRQTAGHRKGSLARHRDMRVLGEKQRLEPALFDRFRQLDRLNRVVCRRHREAEINHRRPPSAQVTAQPAFRTSEAMPALALGICTVYTSDELVSRMNAGLRPDSPAEARARYREEMN